MAHIQYQQIPVPGSKWTSRELDALNIRVESVEPVDFFSGTDLQLVTSPVSGTILNNVEFPDGRLSKTERQFYQYMKGAELPRSEDSSEQKDFSAFILQMLDYDDDDRVVARETETFLNMGGHFVTAKADMCVLNADHDVLFVAQQQRPDQAMDDIESRLIASAIGAYRDSHCRRINENCPALPALLMPGIIMYATRPTFYRIPVSPQFLDALLYGIRPQNKVVVQRLLPRVPRMNACRSPYCFGMRPLENRSIYLQYLEALKVSMVHNASIYQQCRLPLEIPDDIPSQFNSAMYHGSEDTHQTKSAPNTLKAWLGIA